MKEWIYSGHDVVDQRGARYSQTSRSMAKELVCAHRDSQSELSAMLRDAEQAIIDTINQNQHIPAPLAAYVSKYSLDGRIQPRPACSGSRCNCDCDSEGCAHAKSGGDA